MGATIAAAFPWSVGGSVLFGGLVSLLAFLTALAAELYSAVVRPDRSWYESRAAAESVKTLTWRYAVRGESFEESGDLEADRKLLDEFRTILHSLNMMDLQPEDAEAGQITDKMRLVRAQDLSARHDLYVNNRLRHQQAWYSGKAQWNQRRGRRWFLAGISFEFLGVVGGAARAFGGLSVNLLSLFAAAAATITAWVQAKQHQNLATAYAMTSLELAAVVSEAEAITDEGSWSRFVGEAEDAISREHALWRTLRGLRRR